MALAVGDKFVIGDYEYEVTSAGADWASVRPKAADKTKTAYGKLQRTVVHDGVTCTVTSLYGCFEDCVNLVRAPSIPTEYAGVLIMTYTRMFRGCSSLEVPPDLTNLLPTRRTTSGAVSISMNSMFSGCTSLKVAPNMPIVPASWRDAWVEGRYIYRFEFDCRYMFDGCTALVNGPDMSGYDIYIFKVGYMFRECSSLVSASLPTSINNIQGTDTIQPSGLPSVFANCESLESAPELPSDAVGSMDRCFQYCSSLKSAPSVPVGVTSMYATFGDCYSLEDPPNVPDGVTTLDWCFTQCRSMRGTPSVPNSVSSMYQCFDNCQLMTSPPNVPEGVENMQYMFRNCKALQSAPTIPSSATNMVGCFVNCSKLKAPPSIPDGVVSLYSSFSGCASLESAPAIPPTVTTMLNCFYGCTSLDTPPDMTRATNVTEMGQAFYRCEKLQSAPALPASVTSMHDCFYGCVLLHGGLIVKNTPTSYSRAFAGTKGAIFVIPSGAADEATWRGIADKYENVFFFADANSKPALSFEAKRVAADQDTMEDTGGTWVYVTATATAYKDRLPEGYGNSIVSLSMRANGQAESVTWQVVSTEEVDFKVTRTYRGWFEATTAKQALAMTVTDEYAATSPTITAVLPSTAMLLDFLAGSRGTGLAIGKRATRDGFDCVLPAYFEDVMVTGDVLDSGGEPRYVERAGDTMGGPLHIEVPADAQNNNGNELEFRNQRSIVDTRIGNTPSSNQYWGSQFVRDANGDAAWYNQQSLQASGRLYRSYVVQRKSADGATAYSNGFYLGLEADGKPYISFTPDRTAANPGRSAWVEGLGLDIYGQYTSLSSSLTLTTSGQKLPLKNFKGKNCSATTDNGIKAAQAGTYMVWGSAYVHSGYTENDLVHVCIYKNSTSVLDDNDRASNANPYQTRKLGPIFLDLAANDVVYLYAYNQSGARGTIASRDNMGLFVKRVW